MRYSRDHKRHTRDRILDRALNLFCERGFDAVSIDDVMSSCELTRGGFYAHFTSKGMLYREAIKYGVMQGLLNPHIDNKERTVTECVLSPRFAFLTTDLSHSNEDVRSAYAMALHAIIGHLDTSPTSEQHRRELLLTQLMAAIGAASVTRTIADASLRSDIFTALSSQRHQPEQSADYLSSVLWESAYSGARRPGLIEN